MHAMAEHLLLLNASVVPHLSSISYMAISKCQVPLVLEHISTCLCASQLRSFSLTSSHLNSEWCRKLALELLAFKQLERLELCWNSICDSGMLAIANLILALASLNYVDIRWNEATIDGREACKKAVKRSKRSVRLLDV
jgi:hypothetical protein